MKSSFAPLGLAVALCLLAVSTASATSAAPLPAFLAAPADAAVVSPLTAALADGSAPLPATPAQSGCGITRFSCEPCSPASTGLRLCSERICDGTVVIIHCDACKPTCVPPPA